MNELPTIKTGKRPVSTYRVQFHAGFNFEAATKLVPYWHALGVTHLYSSPILQARQGSMHGYDITDHNKLNPEVGTEEQFRALVGELKRHGMELLLDIVPNHMGVGHGTNPWWQDVLENGRASDYASFFDIDWEPVKPELMNKVLIPILGAAYGEVLESGQLKLEFTGTKFRVAYYEKILPLDPQTWSLIFEPLGDLRVQPPEVSPPEDERSELETVLWDLRQLPPNSAKEDTAARRRKAIPGLLDRFTAIVQRSPRVHALIEHAVAIVNGTPGDPHSYEAFHRLLEAQAYRLSHWRVSSDEINYRRFFDVNDLVGLRMEEPRVFAETHRLVRRLLADGSVSGLRLDHPDGLLNPVQYFTRLQMLYVASQCMGPEPEGPQAENGVELAVQEAFGQRSVVTDFAPLYLLVEKILEHGEHLPGKWPVDGTVGYDFTNLVNGVFVDARNERALTLTYTRFTGMTSSVEDMIYEAKKLILNSALASEVTVLSHMLDAISARDRSARDFTRPALTEAIRETIACFPVYRTYIDERGNIIVRDRAYITEAVTRAKRRNPGTVATIFDFLRDILLLKERQSDDADAHRERLQFTLKFQQLTGPVMAKGLEDTVCYRYNRLMSNNEVGGSPEAFAVSTDEFHRRNEERLRDWPHSMLATSTHDTKRSEDTRARIDVVSEMPKLWTSLVFRWRRVNRTKKRTLADGRSVPDANEEYLLYQTLVGTWPADLVDGAPREEYVRRVQEYMNKAVHEAKVNLSWVNDNAEYVEALRGFIERVMRPGTASRPNSFVDDMRKFAPTFVFFGGLNSLAQTVLKIAAPGVPDTYQGTELFDYSMVDPDNRRTVDYKLRRRYREELEGPASAELCDELLRNLPDGRIKLWTTVRALRFRRDNPELLLRGDYIPMTARNAKVEHVVAFARRHAGRKAIVAVPRLAYTLMRGEMKAPLANAWGDAELPAPEPHARYTNVFTGETVEVKDGAILCRELFRRFPVALLTSA